MVLVVSHCPGCYRCRKIQLLSNHRGHAVHLSVGETLFLGLSGLLYYSICRIIPFWLWILLYGAIRSSVWLIHCSSMPNIRRAPTWWRSGYPWYQPFLWISRSWGYDWHPDVIFYFGFDGLIAIFAAVGLVLAWKKNRWLFVWAISGLVFLLLWPTKWPQYTLVLLPAMCLLAAPTLRIIYQKLREQETYWEWFSTMFPGPAVSS